MWFLSLVFGVLLLTTFARADAREAAREKPLGDWVVDVLGLTIQGTVVPVLQATAGIALLAVCLPGLAQSVSLSAPAAFALNFVVVDYLYYWNHRWMHSDAIWPIHRVHHSATAMDVFATSRNTLWTSALIVYLWVNGLALYLLADPAPYAAGATLTAALDLWRHSPHRTPPTLLRWFGGILVFPEAHARHHASDTPRGNYAANWLIWDRIHGTALDVQRPSSLGLPTGLSVTKTLLWPFP